jgi:hypothetical protein
MPTHEELLSFWRDWDALTAEQQRQFRRAVARFVEDLNQRRAFRPGLRVKGVQGTDGIFEMTWAADGRATFQYGTPLHDDQPHIIWRRVGTHRVFEEP